MLRTACSLLLLLVLLASPVSAVITFTQLDQDTFTVSHRIKVIGSRGKATRLVNEKAASLCVAAGFTHMEVMDSDSAANQPGQAANVTVRVQYFFEDGEDRVSCEVQADPEYIEQATKKLEKKGYQPPEKPEPVEPTSDIFGSKCSVEQITTMVKAGLTEDQIKAACGDG